MYYEDDQEDFGPMDVELAHNSSKNSKATTSGIPTMSYPTDKMADYVERSRSKSIKKTTAEKSEEQQGSD